MPIQLTMPALSPTMEKGTLAKWLVSAGDSVAPGDMIAEIETDKATMEFEAVDPGVITELLLPEGAEDVVVGTAIAMLASEGEPLGQSSASTLSKPRQPSSVDAPQLAKGDPNGVLGAAPVPKADAETTAVPLGEAAISPLALKLAKARGTDLSKVTGSGPAGRIMKVDVTPPSPRSEDHPPAPESSGIQQDVTAPDMMADAPFERQKLPNIRKITAQRLTQSKQQIPHFYQTVACKLDALLALRSRLNEDLVAQGTKLSVNDLIIKAGDCVTASTRSECPVRR